MITKQDVAEFYMMELINLKDENKAIERLFEWIYSDNKGAICRNFGTDEDEFGHYIGRRPTKKEFEDWCHYLEKGVEAQLDWEMINQCAADNFKRGKK